LRAAGATHYAMPCNTAYHWIDALREGLDAPFLHIADAAVDQVASQVPAGARIGVIATEATHAIGLYAHRLQRAGLRRRDALGRDNARVVEGIAAVKRGDAAEGGRRFAGVVEALAAAGCRAVVLGCTEVPPGLEASALVPPSRRSTRPTRWRAPASARGRPRALRARTVPGVGSPSGRLGQDSRSPVNSSGFGAGPFSGVNPRYRSPPEISA
jgi:hypothetical protein